MNSKELIAMRVAREFENGVIVNLGAGIPSNVVKYINPEQNIVIQSENGITYLGGTPVQGQENPYCVNASNQPCTILPGGAVVDSATSFGMIRGGHVGYSVLGAMQVDSQGSIANWMVPGGKYAGMGGAMDLVEGAKEVIVAMEHTTRDGQPKILPECTFPLTGYRVVDLIVTELAVIEVAEDGLLLTEIAPGITVDDVRSRTAAPLRVSDKLKVMLL